MTALIRITSTAMWPGRVVHDPASDVIVRAARRVDSPGPCGRHHDGAPGHVPEGDVAVERALPGHAEHPLADDVAGHLGGPAADARNLAHQEVGPAVGDGTVVVGPRPAVGSGDLERDGGGPGRRHPGEQPADGGRLVGHGAGAHPVGRGARCSCLADHLEHAGLADEVADAAGRRAARRSRAIRSTDEAPMPAWASPAGMVT